MHFATRAVHAAQPSESCTGALVAPIFQTSTFEQHAPGVHRGFDYSRTSNPTRRRLEEVLADLEGTGHAAVFASGLAAEAAVLQGLLQSGDAVVIPPDVYGGTFRQLNQVHRRFGVETRTVDLADLNALDRALDDARVRIVWVESPTNPRLLIYDIEAIARLARRRERLVVVDNTFATPLLQRPFELGADVVIHSVTKYLAGHSDLIQGAVLTRDAALIEPIRFLQNALGATPSPFDCWLTLRGLKTLELRMQRHCENARRIALAAAEHPAVARVYYPGAADHPGHALAARQMSDFGGMLSIELRATVEQTRRFVSERRYFVLGESLGGVKSLICHPATMTHASIPASRRAELGLADTLVRLSPGIEHPDDLVEDVVEGLNRLATFHEPKPPKNLAWEDNPRPQSSGWPT